MANQQILLEVYQFGYLVSGPFCCKNSNQQFWEQRLELNPIDATVSGFSSQTKDQKNTSGKIHQVKWGMAKKVLQINFLQINY